MLGVQVGDAIELRLDPVIFDTALAVEAQILRDGAVGEVADVLGGDAVQPGLAVIARERQHGPVRAIDQDGCLGGRALLAERVAVMPDGAGVRSGLRRGNCRHVLNFTGLRFLPMATQPASQKGLVVTLDGVLHDPATPLLHADDLAVVRGDGIFESLLVRDGRPCLLEAHLGAADAVGTDDRSTGAGSAALARGRRHRGIERGSPKAATRE